MAYCVLQELAHDRCADAESCARVLLTILFNNNGLGAPSDVIKEVAHFLIDDASTIEVSTHLFLAVQLGFTPSFLLPFTWLFCMYCASNTNLLTTVNSFAFKLHILFCFLLLLPYRCSKPLPSNAINHYEP